MPPPRVVVDAVTVDEYGALAVQLPCAFTVEFGRTDLRFYDVEAVTAPIEFAVTADNVSPATSRRSSQPRRPTSRPSTTCGWVRHRAAHPLE